MHHIFSSSSTIATSTLATHEIEQSPTKDMGENIVHATAATPFSQPLLPIAIVQLTLLRVWQYFIGKAYFFELEEETESKQCMIICNFKAAFCEFLPLHEHLLIKKVHNETLFSHFNITYS